MITIAHLTKKYGTKVALHDICFTIPDNCVLGLIGPNGAGKSTLLKILTQIIDYNQGEIYFDDKLVNQNLFKQIGYLPEQRGLYNNVEIERQLIYFATMRGLSVKLARERVDYWLRQFDINSWRHQKISELSKGMQQKIQFISCLINSPEYVFMDEPLSGIDPLNFKIFTEQILDYQRNTGATVMLSTHNMKSIEKMCSHVAFLLHSNLVLNGSIEDVKRQFVLENIYTIMLEDSKENLLNKNIECLLGDCFRLVSIDESTCYVSSVRLLYTGQMLAPNAILQNILQIFDKFRIISCQLETPSMDDIFLKVVENNE